MSQCHDSRRWSDWRWQYANSCKSVADLKGVFPNLPVSFEKKARMWEAHGFRFLITPYVLSLVKKGKNGCPMSGDPLWRQVFPTFAVGATSKVEVTSKVGPDEYTSVAENWEEKKEMLTPICQRKYENRAIIYVADSCLGYCMYCFRSLQSRCEKEKHGGLRHWEQTLKEIKSRPQIEEVILSGGDPLVLPNKMIEDLLSDIRKIKTVRAIRIHTRAWTHNPFRIDRDFCALLKKYAVTEMGVHVIHPKEITDEFVEAAERIRKSGAKTMLLADIPLVKGVNDDAAVLRDLFMGLYINGVKPYYLSHNMPNIPYASAQRTSVKRGLALYYSLKRRISNPAMPEYIITHKSGKKTVPESPRESYDFKYAKNARGWPIIRFKDWRGKWQTYLDAK